MPNAGQADDERTSDEAAEGDYGDEGITYEGAALRLDESYQVTNALRPQFVLLMGDKDAGKTTLLAELHHSFLQAPFAGYLFAGSRTLIGFEERCFLSRLQSGLENEDTERTKSRDIRLLHLSLAPEAMPARRTDMLFGDVSGERYREIKTSVEEARELAPVIQRADHVVFLVDGDRLSEPKTRMLTQSNASLLLRGLLEAGGLGYHGSLHVVLSKWDYIVARSAEDEVARLEAILTKTAGKLVLQLHHIAARVTNAVPVPQGYGLAQLLTALLSPTRRHPRATSQPTLEPASRAFLRYQFPSRTS